MPGASVVSSVTRRNVVRSCKLDSGYGMSIDTGGGLQTTEQFPPKVNLGGLNKHQRHNFHPVSSSA